ncbi:unnamed protein product [Effrenium voratum]|nr:unnamed protein product [Effrenium voratum]CAJ1446048.1 unnamed protein product [Effrenium voratum]
MPAAALEETAHDVFVSTSLVLYLLALFSAQHGTKQVQTYLQSFLCQFLPDKVQLNVKINDCTLHLSLNQGRVSLSELTARTAFRERQKSLRRKITRSMGEERGLADVLVQLFRWNEYKWLFRALLQGLTPELENGIACKQFESTPLESDAFDWSEPDWRDPNVRLARLQAALTTRSRHKKKGQSANEKLSRRQLGQRKAQTAMARSMLTFRHRRQERSQYWQTVRKKFASAVRVHTAFDGSRVGGRKWVTFCVLSGGLACWAPPVRYRDGGYRPPDSEQKPNQAEQERLDLRTLEFLEELRSREATAEPTSVVQKVSRLPSYEQIMGLDHTLSCILPHMNGLSSFLPTDAEAGKPLLELPTLCLTADGGPDVNSALMFLQYGAGLRMISFWDPRHRISRELENSITHGGSGLRGAMLAAEFILSFQRGPWSGHKWHRILQEEASEWLAQAAGQSDALVQHLLPGIGKELGLSQTDISRTDILAGLANAKFLQHRGPASASRWDAFHAGWSERRSELSLMLGLLISFGLKCGYLSGVLNKAGWSETRAAECDDKSTLKAETKAQMYRQCRNKLHVVTMTLLNTDVVSMIQAWYCISVPVSHELHGIRSLLSTGKEGCRQHWLEQARGGPLAVAGRILEQLLQPDTLESTGLWFEAELCGNAVGRMSVDHPQVRLQDKQSQRHMKMALTLVFYKLVYASPVLFGYPMKLVLLLGTEAEQAATLVHLRPTWRSTLLRQGLVVMHKSWPRPCLSLGVWPGNSGVLLVPLQECKYGWSLADAALSTASLVWAQVSCFTDWSVLPSDTYSPLHMFARHKERDLSALPLVCKSDEDSRNKVPLLEYSAQHAYWDLPASILKLLAKEEFAQDAAVQDSHLVGELLRVCVEKALKVSPEKAADIMESNLHHRHADDKQDLIDLLKQPAFEELVHARDQQEVQDALKQAKASHQAFLDVAGAISRVRKAGSKAKAVKRKPVNFASFRVFDAERVSAWLPDGSYRCYRDTFNKCWRIFHKSGWSMSRSWGPSGNESAPVESVVQGAWERHKMFHPNCQCPFDFKNVVA